MAAAAGGGGGDAAAAASGFEEGVLGVADCSAAAESMATVPGRRHATPGTPDHGLAAQEPSFRSKAGPSDAARAPKSTAAQQQLGVGADPRLRKRKRRNPKRRNAARSDMAAAAAASLSSRRALGPGRDLPDQLEAHAHRLLRDAGWSIRPRVRSDRPTKMACCFTAPERERGAVRTSLAQAWRLCGRRLLVRDDAPGAGGRRSRGSGFPWSGQTSSGFGRTLWMPWTVLGGWHPPLFCGGGSFWISVVSLWCSLTRGSLPCRSRERLELLTAQPLLLTVVTTIDPRQQMISIALRRPHALATVKWQLRSAMATPTSATVWLKGYGRSPGGYLTLNQPD